MQGADARDDRTPAGRRDRLRGRRLQRHGHLLPVHRHVDVKLIGVEAAGEGIETGRHAASLTGGSPGVLHGNRTYLLQDEDGQIIETHSISAGPRLSGRRSGARLVEGCAARGIRRHYRQGSAAGFP
ncbi:hypothetical protein Lal_00013856 [Lupinus albus]|nr:hypothetical protein Lal_00013856 [Lupinus albus]